MMHYLAFAENMVHAATVKNEDMSEKTTTTSILFGESEFPPLKSTDEGWQLVDKNYDQDEPYSMQHQQEEDWQCIVDDQTPKPLLYAQIAQEAAMLPIPSSPSKLFKKTPPTPNFMNYKNNNKENEAVTLLDEDIGDELFVQYKSSSWLRRRRYHRLSYNHHHHPTLRHHAHSPTSFLRQPSYHHHLQRDQQESTNGALTIKHPKHPTPTAAPVIKRRSRTTTKKQPTRTWIERENGWVAIHAKIHNK
ncbi:hypothetical protein BDA99DRAFT_526483 [Phascolomyces articulosus]|uniref:Uncharacterized protein n=1 Tax=Phascolomyces articulosus TaxID=60185 RepID=A0AAD5P821_9FUNG|nr:hypothetical protein BDA99DRAFT_526483 [Phascolomyces articulosus]